MTTPDKNSLLRTCAQLDPDYRRYIDDSQCTPEQKERIAAISRYILDELSDIRRELLEIAESRAPKDE